MKFSRAKRRKELTASLHFRLIESTRDETMSDYRYLRLLKPSRSLRLIQILPADEGEDLGCTIQTYHTLKKPPYQALSYTWGDPGAKVRITLSGKRFFVTLNLESALRSLRCKRDYVGPAHLPIWIDAMCINQENAAERDEQVRRMKSIYQEAARVVIWLGNYEEPCDNFLHITSDRWGIDHLDKCSESLTSSVFSTLARWGGSDWPYTRPVSGDFPLIENPQFWAQLAKIFWRPWFERLWIIQELGVAKRAVALWGRVEIIWVRLEDAAKFILRPWGPTPSSSIVKLFPFMGAHRISQASLKSMLNLDSNNILTVLHNTQATKCSDPRDRVVSDTQDIEIDYSIPVEQVYRNWAEKRIRRTNTLDILSTCADSSRFGDLPSWVPDLRRLFGQDKPLWIWIHIIEPRHRKQWGILDAKCNKLEFSADGLELAVQGQFLGMRDYIDFITTAGDGVSNLQDPTDLKLRLREIVVEWRESISKNCAIQFEDTSYLNSFQNTVLRGDFQGLRWVPEWIPEEYEVLTGAKSTLSSCILDGVWHSDKQESRLKDYSRSFFPKLHGCQMFVTTTKHFGIVAENCQAQVGDVLALLSGGHTPFVLRQVSSAKYRLLGPCYLRSGMRWMDSNSSVGSVGIWDKCSPELITLV
jgi:hypothetical protein